MNNLKIIEFSPQGLSTFAKYLQFLARKKSWEWTLENHAEYDAGLLDGASTALVDSSLSAKILPQLRASTTQVRAVETLDSLFIEDGSWYPRILLHEALRLVLVAEARDLEIRAPAFVVGDNDEARTVAGVLADIGFSEIFLVGDVMKLLPQKIILSRSQLGIQFHILPAEELTMQAVSAGVVVNTDDLSEKKSLLTDLSYFNFMKSEGYAIDLNIYPLQNLLLEEAEKADLRTLSPVSILEKKTSLWLQRMKMGSLLSNDEIHQTWKDFLQENPSSV